MKIINTSTTKAIILSMTIDLFFRDKFLIEYQCPHCNAMRAINVDKDVSKLSIPCHFCSRILVIL